MNVTASVSPLLSSAQQLYLATARPFYYRPESSLLSWIPDHLLALLSPVVAYWIASGIFHILDCSSAPWLNSYRIHPSEEVKSRNLASRMQVLVAVILQQVLQTAIGLWWLEKKPVGEQMNHLGALAGTAPVAFSVLRGLLGEKLGAQLWSTYGHEVLYFTYWWAIPSAKILFGMFVIDTWEYFLHRWMHNHTWLYKTFHSVHHRLYVPYAYGALYNHPLEGFVLDSVGAGIAELLAHLTTREAIFLFTISTLKTVDDHCGYKLPWDPLQLMTSNNADYHDIHHQIIGIKSNFAQPFFVHWDVILGTRMTRADIQVRKRKNAEKAMKTE